MTKREVELVVLCEDQRHLRTVRRFLIKLGFEDRKIRPLPASAGKGSAEQYVRETYLTELQALRRQLRMGRHAALVVVTDCDNLGVVDRRRQLDAVAQRNAAEPVAFLLPKWSIETWILDLMGEAVDETEPKKSMLRNGSYSTSQIVEAAWQRWLAHRQGDCQDSLPSLRAAASELERLPGVEPPATPPPTRVG